MFPNYQQVLVAQETSGATGGTVQVNPPSAGWPSGAGFQINFARDPDNVDSLLAQSQQFTFVSGVGSSISSSSTASSPSGTLTVSNTVPSG